MTEEQFKLILEKSSDDLSIDLNNYIERLSSDLKLKYIDLYDFNRHGAFERILYNVDDNDICYEILKVACFKETNIYGFHQIFKYVPKEYKEKFLLVIREREKELHDDIIEPYNIVDFLRQFAMEDRSRIFKEIIFENFWSSNKENKKDNRFDYINYLSVLEAFKGEFVPLEDSSMFDVLKFMASKIHEEKDEYSGENKTLSNIGRMVGLFYTEHYDVKEVLKSLINLNYVDKSSLYDLTDYLPVNMKKEVAYVVIDGFKNIGDSLVDYNFYNIISKLNQNEIIEAINKYVINAKQFNYSYPFGKLYDKQIDYMYFVNVIFSSLPKEELDKNFERLHIQLISNEKLPEYDIKYQNIIKIYSEKFDVNYDNLTKFIERFGFSTLKFIDNDNIRKYINMPVDNFNRLLSIFDDDNLYFDKSIKNDIVNSLLQRQFMLSNSEIYNVFNAFEVCVFNKDENGVRKLLEHIGNRIKIDEYLFKNNINYEQFVRQIMNGKLGVLHQVTNRYIAFEREQYVKNRIKGIDSILLLDKVITREAYKKDYLENRSWHMQQRLNDLDRELFTKNQLKLLDNNSLFHIVMNLKKTPKDYKAISDIEKYFKNNKIDYDDRNIILNNVLEFMKDPKTFQKTSFMESHLDAFNELLGILGNNYNIFNIFLVAQQNPINHQIISDVKTYMKEFNGLLDILYDNKIDFSDYNMNYSYNQKFPYDFVQKNINPEFLLGIFAETNFKGVENTLNNPELFGKLNGFLSKYKMLGWGRTFEPLLKECDLLFEEGTLAGLISNFDKIVDKIENKATLTSVIDYSNCYSTVSNFYALLFGRDDYNLIAANDGRNKASMSKYNRLKGNLELVKDMYGRKEMTVPPVNQEFALSNGKSLGVILGNNTNMINLTYGERTESCLRMGGAFDDLFHYCIQDKNGFHIRFVDPKTGEFVSRVSGFRNGNTIFLNELRDSVSGNYNNEELYDVLKQVSRYLISSSKDSDVPINNILITPDYALREHESQCQNVIISDRQKAFRELNFNMTEKALVLATSSSDNSIVPYYFSDDVPMYDVVRDDIRIYRGNKAINRVIQLRTINDLLNGVQPEEIDIMVPVKEYDYVISGEDFYVGFKNNKPDIFVMDKSKDDIRTNKEVSGVLKNSSEYLSQNKGSVKR